MFAIESIFPLLNCLQIIFTLLQREKIGIWFQLNHYLVPWLGCNDDVEVLALYAYPLLRTKHDDWPLVISKCSLYFARNMIGLFGMITR